MKRIRKITLVIFFLVISLSILLQINQKISYPKKVVLLSTNTFVQSYNNITGESSWRSKNAGTYMIDMSTYTNNVVETNQHNASHKSILFDFNDDGKKELFVAYGNNAGLYFYNISDNKKSNSVWKPPFLRIRDMEIGNVDNSEEKEIVVVTHKQGIVGILSYLDDKWDLVEINNSYGKITFIHEVEIGDVDNDGFNEFVTTPTAPNVKTGNQPGKISVFKYINHTYEEIIVDEYVNSSVKEIIIGDINNDGLNEIVASKRGRKKNGKIIDNLKIIYYKYNSKNGFDKHEILTLDDFRSRGMVIGDIEKDGVSDLVIGTESIGVIRIIKSDTRYEKIPIDSTLKQVNSVYMDDFDNDQVNEIIVASNEESKVYMYDYSKGVWEKNLLLSLPPDTRIWAISAN